MTEASAPLFLSASKYGGIEDNQIAYKTSKGRGDKQSPGLIWCGGLKSDMEGSKATALHDWADSEGRAFLRFDYFGHGESTGKFTDGGISRWAADTIQVIDELTEGPQILIGSSMGGWTSMIAAMARPERVKGLLLIAPAPDFTEKLMWANFSDDIRKTIMEEGVYYEPSDYDEPMEISKTLILDGRKNLILDAPLTYEGPVRILQGRQDASVPWDYPHKIMEALSSDDVEMTLVKNGDHSLSAPDDLDRLIRVTKELCRLVS